jgi:hypothetical protein
MNRNDRLVIWRAGAGWLQRRRARAGWISWL